MKLKETLHYSYLYEKRNLNRLYRTDITFSVLSLLVGIFAYFSLWFGLYFIWLSGQLGKTFDSGELLVWQDLLSLVKVLFIASTCLWALNFGYLLYHLRSFFRIELIFDKNRLSNYLKKTRDAAQLMKEFVISRLGVIVVVFVVGNLISIFIGKALAAVLEAGLGLHQSTFGNQGLFMALLFIVVQTLIVLAEIYYLARHWIAKNEH